jgi:hypothetical protein
MSAAFNWQTILVVVFALGIAAFTSAFAQAAEVGPARAAAIHECSIQAAKHKEYVEETTYIATYRTCMAERGQVE